MASVTVNRPEPVELPPTTYTLELSEAEAIYVVGTLGIAYPNTAREVMGEEAPSHIDVYSPLRDALTQPSRRLAHKVGREQLRKIRPVLGV